MQEIESKILNIDCEDVIRRLTAIGAVFQSKKLFQVQLFSVPASPPHATLRLRKEGDIAKLTFKTHVKSSNPLVKVREEREVEVSDYEVMEQILIDLGYKVKQKFSKFRTEYLFEGASVVIDEYQGEYNVIAPLLEIEAVSAEEVIRVAECLGFNRNELSTKGFRDFVREYNIPELS